MGDCDKGNLPTCACCGYKTVGGEYDICAVCMWECDFAQETDFDFPLGANGFTLRQSQQNFMKSGNCDGAQDTGHYPSLEKYDRDPEWSPLPAKPDPVEDARAWRRIRPPLEPRSCLCCGYATLFHEGDACRICGWTFRFGYEPDPYLRFPERNDGLSLYEGQQNYQEFGVFSEKYLPMRTEPRPDDKRASWWKPAPPPSDPSKFRTYVPVRKTESGGAWSSES